VATPVVVVVAVAVVPVALEADQIMLTRTGVMVEVLSALPLVESRLLTVVVVPVVSDLDRRQPKVRQVAVSVVDRVVFLQNLVGHQCQVWVVTLLGPYTEQLINC
jgi:hypothetical protein